MASTITTRTFKGEKRTHSIFRYGMYGAIFATCWAMILSSSSSSSSSSLSCILEDVAWTAVWMMSSFVFTSHSWGRERAWKHWESKGYHHLHHHLHHNPANNTSNTVHLEIARVDMRNQTSATILSHLETMYGPTWRTRPLLLQHLWTADALADPTRHLSKQGLLQLDDLTIDYFSNATSRRAVVPDARGPVSRIVANMTNNVHKNQHSSPHGPAPHKIGSQKILDAHPEWIYEVTRDVITTMFGDRFQPKHLLPWGPFGLFPALTTVPVFVAHTIRSSFFVDNHNAAHAPPPPPPPHTFLHCEPIGNVAVQLSGSKQWTLVSPEYSWQLRPVLAPDGRAFFASYVNIDDQGIPVPHYSVVTKAGDALWLPTWTWHHVDYVVVTDDNHQDNDDNDNDDDLAIGASLFHFRPMEYLVNNPLFAIMMIPAILKEATGFLRQ